MITITTTPTTTTTANSKPSESESLEEAGVVVGVVNSEVVETSGVEETTEVLGGGVEGLQRWWGVEWIQ